MSVCERERERKKESKKEKGQTLVYESLIKKVRSECSVWRRGLIVLLKEDFKGRLVSGLRGMRARMDEEEEEEEEEKILRLMLGDQGNGGEKGKTQGKGVLGLYQ